MFSRFSAFIALNFVLLAAVAGGDVPEPQRVTRALTPQTVPQVASYELRARLDPIARTVHGSGRILFTNPSSQPTRHLYFHLYLNAFENEHTLFQRGKGSRSGSRRAHPGRIDVHSLRSSTYGGRDLWPPNAHSPSDEKDRTDIKVPLPHPLGGNESIELEVDFTAYLPQLVERTGYERDFFLVAHWFPKLAKLEPSGRWAHFSFHPHGEFYADFGNYNVTLEVPEGYLVGSTGTLSRANSTTPHMQKYVATARGVHDFAWTAWPRFVEAKRRVGEINVTLLHQENSPRVAERTLNTLERGLLHLSDAYGPYPYPTLTAVQPPRWASRAGGMEYPQFITTGGNELLTYLGVLDTELVTIHELAHQWFQGMVASNEMQYPFLDEGLTSYAESRYLNETYGAGSLVNLSWLKVSRHAGSRYINLKTPGRVPIASSADEFKSFRELGSLVYARTALCLETLGQIHSPQKLHKALHTYAIEHRFRHPEPADLFSAIEREMGTIAREQAEMMFLRRGRIDHEVRRIATHEKDGALTSRISLSRKGALEIEADLLIQFKDGTSEERTIPATARSSEVSLQHKSPITFVLIDPKRRVLIDDNLHNNRMYAPGVIPERGQQFFSYHSLFSWALLAVGL